VAVDLASSADLMAARQYDVIVVDPYLTGGVLDGDGTLLAMIRNRQPSAALIVLTGYGSASLTISAERERAMAVLTKPQSVVHLSQLVLSQLVGDASRNPAVGETRV
jgi:DNA-binding NtrC family response regulator